MRKTARNKKSFKEIIKNAPKKARQVAFKKKLPIALIKNGRIIMEYEDKTTKVISKDEILNLNFNAL